MPLLDWLRFGAALMVVLGHCRAFSFSAYGQLDSPSQASLVTKLLFGATRYGSESVLVFFVLSGFLVGGATFRRLEGGTFDLRSYATDRLSRIMLPLIPAVLLTTTLHFLLGSRPTAIQVLGNLLSLQGRLIPTLYMNQPLWSLSYEVWFYVLNGAVAVLLSGRSKAWAFAVLCASLACFAFLQLEYLVIWYLGALLFLVSGGKPSGARLFAVLVVTAAAVAFWELLGARLPVLVSFMFVCAAMLLIRELAALRPKPNLLVKLGSRLAGFSYSLYLIHYPLLVIIDQLAPRSHAINAYSLGLYFLRVGVSVAGGYVFYLCFERHTPRVRRWLRDISESPTRRDGRETTKSALGSEETAPESDVLGRT